MKKWYYYAFAAVLINLLIGVLQLFGFLPGISPLGQIFAAVGLALFSAIIAVVERTWLEKAQKREFARFFCNTARTERFLRDLSWKRLKKDQP